MLAKSVPDDFFVEVLAVTGTNRVKFIFFEPCVEGLGSGFTSSGSSILPSTYTSGFELDGAS